MANEFPHPFSKLAQDYRELRRRLPKEISILAAGHFKDNFKRQGYLENGSVVAWKKRKNDTGKKRALLIKSGRLRRAIAARSDYGYARVINSVPYAAAHNEGMVINTRANIGKFSRKRYYNDEVSAPGARKEKWVKKHIGDSQVRAHSRQMNTTIPARPFMITTPDLMEEIEEHFFGEIDKIWKQ